MVAKKTKEDETRARIMERAGELIRQLDETVSAVLNTSRRANPDLTEEEEASERHMTRFCWMVEQIAMIQLMQETHSAVLNKLIKGK